MSKEIVYRTSIEKLSHLNMYYLPVPPDVIEALGGGFKRRLWVSVNGKITYQGGLMSLGQGAGYISIHSKRMKQAGVKPGEEVNIAIAQDYSEYGLPLPEELAALLREDDEARNRFHSLTKGKQRNMIVYISAIKNSQSRWDRAVKLLDRLKLLKPGSETIRKLFGVD